MNYGTLEMHNGKSGKMNEIRDAYYGKKVFITGHTGFKGSWLIKILKDFGAIIKGYALAPENEINLYKEINGNSLCDSVIGDVRNNELLTKSILDFNPDFIFHLAAQPLVRTSYKIPSETFEINAIGTANLLDAVRLLEKKCTLVIITTDKVYHNNEWDYPYRENDKLGGYDPYSASKACSELVIDSYKNSFFNLTNYNQHKKAIAIGRAGNVIGGGDWSKDRLIPDIVKSLNAKQKIIIRSPKSIRPWQHVIEPIFGYLKLGLKLNFDPIKFSQPYNFGPYTNDELSVKEMVVESIKLWGSGNYLEDDQKHNLHEANLLKLDISKAVNNLNWKPVLNSQMALELTINWYKKFYDNINATELMELDIQYYENRINK